MTANVAVIGETGQLGRALLQAASEMKFKTIGLGRSNCDLSADQTAINTFLRSLPQNINALVLAAAYTQVDRAETDPETAFSVNSIAPALVAKFCKHRSIPLIHFSTDYVFSGQSKSPYLASHPASPINWYGITKFEGEKAVLASGAQAIILRTSWVFDSVGSNFLTAMLRLSETKDEISVVNDQVGRPTFAPHLAQATLEIVARMITEPRKAKNKIYHATGNGPTVSWAGFAKEIFDQSGKSTHVKPISSAAFPALAKRPAFSVMDMTTLENDFNLSMPDWRKGLAEALKE